MKDKPAYGQPCNGCGLCCLEELCPLGQIVFQRVRGPCPALSASGGAMVCGLVAEPTRYRPGDAVSLAEAALMLIGAGVGCDAMIAGEPDDRMFRARLRAKALNHPAANRRARRAWGIGD